MRVIELSGLPGCGKTTLVEGIIRNFEGCRILTRYDIRSKETKRGKRFLEMICSFFDLRHLKTNAFITYYFFSYKTSLERLRFMIRFIIFNKTLLMQIKKKEADYLILDEGIIQLVTSIPHEQIIIENKAFIKLIKHLKKLYAGTLFLNCMIDNEKSIAQIRHRNSKNNRFDRMPNEKLKRTIETKSMNLALVQKLFKEDLQTFDVDMKEYEVCKIIEIIS